MAEINQIIDSLAQLPQGIDHPIAAAASMVVAVTVGLVERGVHGQAVDDYGVEFSNQALFEQSVTPNLNKVSRERMAPAWATSALRSSWR